MSGRGRSPPAGHRSSDWGWSRRPPDEIAGRATTRARPAHRDRAVGIGFLSIASGHGAARAALARLRPASAWFRPASLYTIPSLALFALLLPFTGLSMLTAEIALVSYTLLILIRNIVAGDRRRAPTGARGGRRHGLRRRGDLFSASTCRWRRRSIVAGIRIATVTTIGLVTVTALVGQGGYGVLINDGLAPGFSPRSSSGRCCRCCWPWPSTWSSCALERLLTPWARAKATAV